MVRSAARSGLVALVLLAGCLTACSEHISYARPQHSAGPTGLPGPDATSSSPSAGTATHLVRYVVTGNAVATTLIYADPLKDTTVTAPPTPVPWSTTLPMVTRPGAYVALTVSVATSQFAPGTAPYFTCQIWVDTTMVAHDSGILAFCNYLWNEKK